MVTHLTTNPPVSCLYMAERTGSLIFMILWSYVKECMMRIFIKSLLRAPQCVVGRPWCGTNIGVARVKLAEDRTLTSACALVIERESDLNSFHVLTNISPDLAVVLMLWLPRCQGLLGDCTAQMHACLSRPVGIIHCVETQQAAWHSLRRGCKCFISTDISVATSKMAPTAQSFILPICAVSMTTAIPSTTSSPPTTL